MESDLDDMRRKLDMAEGSKSALQQQVCSSVITHSPSLIFHLLKVKTSPLNCHLWKVKSVILVANLRSSLIRIYTACLLFFSLSSCKIF